MVDLKFDKEIDVLIRGKTGEAIRVADTKADGVHLDADAFNAFAENVLMPEVRASYIAHMADCGHCRSILANVAASAPAPEEEFLPVAIPVSTSVPWYQKLFAVRNLAYGMGALVLMFSGFIGYTLLSNFEAERASVSSTEKESAPDAQSVADKTAGPMAEVSESDNFASNTAANANIELRPAEPFATPDLPTNAARSAAKRQEIDQETILRSEPSGRGIVTDRRADEELTLSAAPPPPAPAPPPIVGVPAPAARQDERAANATLDGVDSSGPSRSAIQSQNRSLEAPRESSRGRNVGGSPGTMKRSGGKIFMLSEGVWYDQAYSGQRTTNVRRGTNDYKKLDSGLREIAEDVSGTVVVMWKEKAYRIQ